MADSCVVAENPKQPSGGFKKFGHKLKHYFSSPSNVIIVVFGIVLLVLVVYPLIRMILNSIIVTTGMEADALNEEFGTSYRKGSWTLLHWPYLLANKGTIGHSRKNFWIPLGKSTLMSLLACGIAVIIGGVLAFLITRTNMPFKKFVSAVFVFPYIMPSWSIALFWVNFFKNDKILAAPGVGLLQQLTGLCAPEWLVYGFWPTAFVLGLHYAPFAYILIGGILRNMDANLEEAATILKASRLKILGRITLPIVAPAMVSTILLVFSSSISSYTVPYFLNANKSFTSISQSLRSLIMSGMPGSGYVISVILMIFSVLILTLNNWFTKSRKNFTTVSGKSGQISKINIGKVSKWVVAAVIIILVAFFAIFPLVTFILDSLESTPGDLSSISGQYWFGEIHDMYVGSRMSPTGTYTEVVYGIFRNRTVWSAFGRSVLVSAISALVAGTAGILIGYAVAHNRRSRLASMVGNLAFLPYLIPALCFGTIFFSLVHTSAFQFLDVTTTLTQASAVAVCCIAGSVKFLPFASRTGTNAMLQLSGEIEEAAIINGCPWFKRMTRVIFPIQKSSFISGYLLPFISCMRELTLFTLITNEYSLATTLIDNLQRNGIEQFASGMNLMIVVFVIIVNFLVNKVTGASIDKGIGG